MKIFNWMRFNRSGNGATNTSNPPPNSYHCSCNEEFSDWPEGLLLLAIGTFGSNSLKQSERLGVGESPDESDNTNLEEVGITVEQLFECVRRRRRRRGGVIKKSLSFLIKKALLCGGGFSAAPPPPPPMFRDPLPEFSRMEKILRAVLQKRMCSQRQSLKKYLDIDERKSEEDANHRSKWVKTDSEYIVLEM